MSRPLRIDTGGEIYHCLNRTVGKQAIFYNDKDYQLFEKILQETVDVTGMCIFAYSIMPNHFHLVLHPKEDGDLSNFMKRLTVAHTQRYRIKTKTIGDGPVYQGRYKSFIIQNDKHLFTVLRYVERNPFTAKLVKDPIEWKYSSLYRRHKGISQEKQLLSPWVCNEPNNYLKLLTQPLTLKETEKIKQSEKKGIPFGDNEYMLTLVEKYNLQSILRGRGRPKKE